MVRKTFKQEKIIRSFTGKKAMIIEICTGLQNAILVHMDKVTVSTLHGHILFEFSRTEYDAINGESKLSNSLVIKEDVTNSGVVTLGDGWEDLYHFKTEDLQLIIFPVNPEALQQLIDISLFTGNEKDFRYYTHLWNQYKADTKGIKFLTINEHTKLIREEW